MNTPRQPDQDLEKSEAALRRAAQKARELAERTRTPLVTYKDGKVRKAMAVHEPRSVDYGKRNPED